MNFYFRYSSSTFGCSALLLCNGGSMGGGPGGWPTPSLVSDPSEVRRAEKCFRDPPPPHYCPPPFSQGLDLSLLCSKKKQLLLDYKSEFTF